jgi:very-short-patch-repair endonuclease
MQEIEVRLRAGHGVVRRSQQTEVSGSLDRMLRKGVLTTLLPGIYCVASMQGDIDTRLRAAQLWAGPDAVLTGHSAARVTYWPGSSPAVVTLALPTQAKRSHPGFAVEVRRIPSWLMCRRGGLTVTAPALTAVDLAGGADGGDAIDRVLRSQAASLEEMWDALRAQPDRVHNRERAALLWDSRDRPWSEAERLQHRLLRSSGLVGWKTNRCVHTASDDYWVDVLFAREQLIVEVDGWEVHGQRQTFEDDRRRRNHLVLAGYRVLNFTWRQLVDDPAWVLTCIRRALTGER